MAVIGTVWAPDTWISVGGWAANTWGTALPPVVDRGPMCATISTTYALLGTISIEGCEEGAEMFSPGNDIPILATGLTDESDDSYVNDAEMEFTVYARNGTTVIAGPTDMDYVAASNGNYRGILQSSVIDALIAAGTMEVGLTYPVKVTAVDGTLDGEWEAMVPLVRRGWNC